MLSVAVCSDLPPAFAIYARQRKRCSVGIEGLSSEKQSGVLHVGHPGISQRRTQRRTVRPLKRTQEQPTKKESEAGGLFVPMFALPYMVLGGVFNLSIHLSRLFSPFPPLLLSLFPFPIRTPTNDPDDDDGRDDLAL